MLSGVNLRVVFTPASCTGTEIESGYRRRNRITSEEIIPNLEGNVKELYGSILCMTVVQKTRLPPVPTLKSRGAIGEEITLLLRKSYRI